ncbi:MULTISPECIES: spermidine/putrescine ABC transporter substrate-binding protein [Desertifilum]|uniref:Polyamine ABC transporter substrate-binding protein n=2 Tax=Desertifilum tharense IPPAS B-1220 TaxID=1781255 RepID=A0ACD5GZH6_9CYAN|nr:MULTISPECIES: spermidine/putrescine ABC transporter substrate-binding protein [Desertifilum]MDA0213475.1 spermidine/putrescine ABC transporter substrate-binding protein [Cyanobacteria bacterium FC1]
MIAMLFWQKYPKDIRFYLGLFMAVLILVVGVHSGLKLGSSLFKNELRIYNWSTYIDPDIIIEFEKQNKIKISYDTYESNEELYEQLKHHSAHYDIIFPSDYMIEIMIAEGMLRKLDRQAIPNAVHLEPQFINPPYDPGNQYSFPYQWGTLGIGYNQRATQTEIDSWSAMFDPQYEGRTAWLDATRYTLGVILIYLGFDPNTTKVDEINQARDWIIQHKAAIAAFPPDTGELLLDRGDVDLTFEWSGDVFQVMKHNPDLRYVIPKEGTIIWMDNIAIPKHCHHPTLAHKFINFVLEPEVGAQISNFIHYGTPNKSAIARGLISPQDLENPGIYPPPEVFSKLQYIKDVGEATALYEQAWAEVRAGIGR